MDAGQIEALISQLIQFIPLVIILAMLGGVMMTLSRFGEFGGDSSPLIVEEPKETPREEAERILMDRFARGEITEVEYTSAMARL